MKFTIRKIHKYLSLFISLQLLLWTASGIYFAYNKIENVRGEQYREQTSFSVDLSKINFEVEDISTLSFANRLNERVVVIRDTQGKKYFDFDGNLIDKISFEDALKVVKTKTNLSPLLVEEVTEAKKRAEYRGVAILSYFFYKQALNWQTIFGLFLIVIGVTIVNIYKIHS